MSHHILKFTKIDLRGNREIVIHAPAVRVKNCDDEPITFESSGRYGFWNTELRELFPESTYLFLMIPKSGCVPVIYPDTYFNSRCYQKTFTIGICAGRPQTVAIQYLNKLGFNPITHSDHSRDLLLESEDYLMVDNDTPQSGYDAIKQFMHVKYLYVKSADIPELTQSGVLNAVVCYGDIWYNLSEFDYNIKYIDQFVDSLADKTRISLISKSFTELKNLTKRSGVPIRIASEYNDPQRLLQEYVNLYNQSCDNIEDQIYLNDFNNVEFIRVSGKVESLLHADIADYAITIVQTGETLEVNGLSELTSLRQIKMNLWTKTDIIQNGKADINTQFFKMFKNGSLKYLVLEGIDGCGKSSIARSLSRQKESHNWLICDRHSHVNQATFYNPDTIKDYEKLHNDWRGTNGNLDTKESNISFIWDRYVGGHPRYHIVVIDRDADDCWKSITERPPDTIQRFEHLDGLNFFRLKYREITAHFGFNYIENNGTLSQLKESLCNFVKSVNQNPDYVSPMKLPAMKYMDNDVFNSLADVASGHSKHVVSYNDRFDIIAYKPSVHSHKKQRTGLVSGTDHERQKTTRNLLYLMSFDGIQHTYYYVGNNGYILAEKHRGIPPVEVCAKRFHVGTHKHMYQDMAQYNDRQTGESIVGDKGDYTDVYIRFDWRNPNHIKIKESDDIITMPHALIYVNPLKEQGLSDDEIRIRLHQQFPNGIPLGDYPLPEDLADKFINVVNAKSLATKTFKTLEEHFKAMRIVFKDVCFMLIKDGSKFYGEISQDCGRYEHMDIETFGSLDKDVWRAGGSSGLVLEKWKKLTQIVNDYTNTYIHNWTTNAFEQEMIEPLGMLVETPEETQSAKITTTT